MKNIKLQAHRGVSSDCPENTMAAFRCAALQGYDVIELDPDYTKDGKRTHNSLYLKNLY